MLKKTRQFITAHFGLIVTILIVMCLIYSGQLLAVWRSIITFIIFIFKYILFLLAIVIIGGVIVYIIGKIKETIEETKNAKETKEDREKRALSQKAIIDESILFRIMRDLADKNDKTEV
jgi:hypothetical protein